MTEEHGIPELSKSIKELESFEPVGVTELTPTIDLKSMLEEDENLTEFDLVKFPDKRLSGFAEEVYDFKHLTDFIRNLYYTMKLNNAIGISAPAVGVDKRIVVLNISEPMILINPIIITASKEMEEFEESSLAYSGFFADVKRHERIMVAYKNENDEALSLDCCGILAATIQHEIDCLNGVQFYDKLGVVGKFLAQKKLKKFIKKQKQK